MPSGLDMKAGGAVGMRPSIPQMIPMSVPVVPVAVSVAPTPAPLAAPTACFMQTSLNANGQTVATPMYVTLGPDGKPNSAPQPVRMLVSIVDRMFDPLLTVSCAVSAPRSQVGC